MISSDRRLSRRWPIQLSCRLEWQGQNYDAYVEDLSFGGAGLRVPVPIEAGEELKLGLSEYEVEMLARAVHDGEHPSGNYRLGIKFRGFSTDIVRQILPVIKAHLFPDADDPITG